MPVTYAGRIEARCVVPTGGAAVSASNAGGGPTTCTVPAGSYFLTSAGDVSGLIAELQTQLNASRPPSSGSWTVSLDTTGTGRVTIACSEPASVSFTSTDLRDALGFAYNFDAPQTPTQLNLAMGGLADFSSGAAYMLNESAGNPAATFGLPASLTASGVTYSNAGPRGGSDKAIGFDAAADSLNGGNNFDLTAANDLAIVWVAKHTATPSGMLFSKYDGGTSRGWLVNLSGGNLTAQVYNGSVATATATGIPTGEWYVGMLALDRSSGKMSVGYRTLTTNTTTISTETTVSAASSSNTEAFCVNNSAWLTGNADTKLAALYIVCSANAAGGLSANLSSALLSFATQMSSQTGTKQARGLWFPDSPLNCDDHPSMAPEDTDLRSTESPTGLTIGLSGNVKYVHTNVRWDRVPVDRIREASATYANASLEVFFRDCISGLGGHAWFTPLSPMQIHWSNAGTDALLGADANDGAGTDGWCITGLSKFSELAKMSQPGFAGQFNVRLPRIVSSG